MGSDRRNDQRDEVHRTVPVFGVSATERSLDETGGPLEESTQNRSPVPIPSPLSEHGFELPSVIEPGVVLLNKYRVLEEIGRGGMGAVWLVEHLGFGEKRALKVIHAVVASDRRVRARFEQEAKILAKLKHPNAVIVHDTGIVGQVAFIEMEYLEGQTLRELLAPGKPIPIATIMWLLKEVCEVLARAHALGIVHRDLKPENIMISSEPLSGKPELKVLDFGIAKIVQVEDDGGPGLTLNTEGLLGTPAYSSPEQNDIEPETNHRRAIDGRSDIYSLGVILFEMLTGSRPFKGRHAQLLYQHAQVEPPRFKEIAPERDIPPAVEAVVRRCLEKSPDKRPQSARELYDELSRAIEEMITREERVTPIPANWEPTPARLLESPVPTLPRAESLARPRLAWFTRRRAAVLAIALLLALGSIAWYLMDRRNWPEPIPPEIKKFLAKRGFEPAKETRIAQDRWPMTIIRTGDDHRTLTLHGRLYLPQGYEPESEGSDDGLPRVVKSQNGVRFIQVPGNSFMMGAFDNSDTFTDTEKPSHHVTLSTFYMQETETTIAEFDRFCKETDRRPNDPELKIYNEARNSVLQKTNERECPNHPASGVSRKLAVLYAQSVGGELPSEAQWEFAARSGGRLQCLYVWGNEPGANPRNRKANLDNNADGQVNTCEVKTVSGDRTEQGIRDLAGNVREWCRDVWKPYTDSGPFVDPVRGPDDGETDPDYVIRGGSYDTPGEYARVTYRKDAQDLAWKGKNEDAFPDVGFRVVLEVLVTERLGRAGGSETVNLRESSP